MAALAAETTPGPLIVVLAFVGFWPGTITSTVLLWMATLGLLATMFYTFLPCFLFVLTGANTGQADNSGRLGINHCCRSSAQS